MAQNEALKQDKKFVAVIAGGALLISLAVILVGTLLAASDNAVVAGIGAVVDVLGWLTVAGTTGVTLMIQARMKQIYGTLKAVRVTSK